MIYTWTHLFKPAMPVIPHNNIICLSVCRSIFLVEFLEARKILMKAKWPFVTGCVMWSGVYAYELCKLFQFSSSSLPKHSNLLARQSTLLCWAHFLTFHTLYPVSLSRLGWPGTHCKPVQPWIHSLPTVWDCRAALKVSSTTFIVATKSRLPHFGHFLGIKTFSFCCFFQGDIFRARITLPLLIAKNHLHARALLWFLPLCKTIFLISLIIVTWSQILLISLSVNHPFFILAVIIEYWNYLLIYFTFKYKLFEDRCFILWSLHP